jgi:hypothetical protein
MKNEIVGRTMASAVAALGMGVISSAARAEDVGNATRLQGDASRFTYARLYCTPDNESHFGALKVDLAKQDFAPPAALIYIGGNQPASSVFLGGFEARWGAADLANHLYHPTPAVQFITVVEGHSRSRLPMARQSSYTRTTWSIWKTRRLAEDTSRLRAIGSASCFSLADDPSGAQSN